MLYTQRLGLLLGLTKVFQCFSKNLCFQVLPTTRFSLHLPNSPPVGCTRAVGKSPAWLSLLSHAAVN